VTLEFARSNIAGFKSNDFSSKSGFVGFLNGVDYKNNSFDVLFKNLTVSNVFLNSFLVNNNEQPLYWLGFTIKLVRFINQNQVPATLSDSVLFRSGNVLNSKVGIKACHFSGNLAGSLVSVVANSKFSLKNSVFSSVRIPSKSFSNFINFGDNSSMKIFNVSFVDSSFTRNVLFNIGSNNIVLLSQVKYANFHYAMFENQENFGIILSAGENNTIAMNDIHVANSSFASPVTHFIFNNLNTINLTRIFVSDNIYLLSDSSVFDLEDTNVFQMNNSLFQNLDFLNQATFFERSMLFSFRVFNVIEFFNNSFTNLVGLGHLVDLFDFNSFYDVQTKCQNINVISPDVNRFSIVLGFKNGKKWLKK